MVHSTYTLNYAYVERLFSIRRISINFVETELSSEFTFENPNSMYRVRYIGFNWGGNDIDEFE